MKKSIKNATQKLKKMQKRLFTLFFALAFSLQLAAPAFAFQIEIVRGYTDVHDGHWTSSSVERAIELGLLEGVSEDEFGWGQPMSRAAFAAALVRLFGWETVSPARDSFTDVTPERWFYSAVETACANGALSASQPEFRPTDGITREEMAAMLVRGLGYTSLAGLALEYGSPFADVSTNKGFITIAYDMGLMSGVGDEMFNPTGVATRELAAAVLMRVYDCLNNQPEKLSSIAGYQQISVRTPAAGTGDALPTTPLEPLADLYSELRRLKENGADMSRYALRLNGGGVLTPVAGGSSSENLTAAQVAEILSRNDVNTYYSERYQSAYCICKPADGADGSESVVWYQSAESLAAKLQMAQLFGVAHYILY